MNTLEATRVRQAADTRTSPATLEDLVSDPAVTVRATLAMNPVVPPLLLTAIAHDGDDRVRALLARRLASLLPSLSESQRSLLEEGAMATLLELATDEAVRVRAAIADVVKAMPNAPRDLVIRLAYDSAVSVAEPVIRLSPLLTNEDLLDLVIAAPSPVTATAVARRADLSERVSEAIAASDDPGAIRALLCNHSAAIREATLDHLIARADNYVDWHQPLVRRPRLSAHATRALSAIVTAQLLAELSVRHDLSPDLAQRLAKDLQTRLRESNGSGSDGSHNSPSIDEAMVLANDMMIAGHLTEDALIAAARRGEARLCTAMIAVAANVDAAVVDRACTLRSAKGIVSLLWRCGFTMRSAAPLQTLLVRLSPEQILLPHDGLEFPLAIAEMRWQLEFLSGIGR